jgi:ProP effector
LKVGIHRDILAAMPELSQADVSRALQFFVSRFGYLESCIEGSPRIDLNGDPAGVASAAEAANAQHWLAKRRKVKPQAAPTAPPKKLSLVDLKAAAAARKGIS